MRSGILFCHVILPCGPVLFIRAHRWSNTLFDNDNYCVVRYSILARDIIIWSGTIHPKNSGAHRLSNTVFDKDNIGWSGTLFWHAILSCGLVLFILITSEQIANPIMNLISTRTFTSLYQSVVLFDSCQLLIAL